MSVRDKKRRGNNQNAELANLEAIAQYQEPKIQVVKTSTIPETTTNPETQPNQTNNDQEIDMNKQTQTTPAANPTVKLNPVSEAIAQIVTEAQQVTTPQGQAGDFTIDVSQPIKEGFVSQDTIDKNVVEHTEAAATDDNPSETPVVSPEDVIKNWVLSQDAPILKSTEGLNIHTLTGKELLEVVGLPTSIPVEVMEAIHQLASATDHLSQYLPVFTTLVLTATDDETHTVNTEKLADTLLAFVKPFLNKIILPKWDAVIKGIEGFIKPPVEATEAMQVTKVEATVEIKLDPKAEEAEAKTETKEEDYKTDPALLVPAEVTILDLLKGHQEAKALKIKAQEQAIAKPTPFPVKTQTFGDLLQGMDVLGS